MKKVRAEKTVNTAKFGKYLMYWLGTIHSDICRRHIGLRRRINGSSLSFGWRISDKWNSTTKHYGIVVFLLFFAGSQSLAQDAYYKKYSIADGLPSMTTYEMVQDSNGILWIGTEQGLVSFNGESFITYSHPELLDNDIIELELSKDGIVMFFNISHQLGMVVDGKIQILMTLDGNRLELISTKTKDYVISMERENGLLHNRYYELIDGKLNLLFKNEINKDIKDSGFNNPENLIYHMVENDSLIFFKDSKRLQYEDVDQKSYNLFELEDREFKVNHFFIAEYEGKKMALMPDYRICYLNSIIPNSYDHFGVQQIVSYGDTFYIVLKNGLDYYDNKSAKKSTLINDIIVSTVFKDNEGNIWVSTRNTGLLKIYRSKLNVKSISEKGQVISGIYASDDHILYFWGDAIELRNKRNEILLSHDFNTDKQGIVKVFENSFIISAGQIFSQIDPSGLKLNIIATTASSSYKSMEIRNGSLYCGRTFFMHKIDFSPQEALPGTELNKVKSIGLNSAYSIKYSKNQDILLAGSNSGLYEIDENDNLSVYIDELSKSNISDIVETVDSSFWIATKTQGIYRLKDGEIITHFNTSMGLISDAINDLDFQGKYIYAASASGITQINMHTSRIINKNSFNGLPADYVTKLCIFKDSIWLAIQNDIVVVDSTFFTYKNFASNLVMHQFYGNNKALNYESGMKLDHDENKIDIVLDHVSLSSGDNKYIKYRLPNLDTSWIISQEATIRLPALQPGKYSVEARGINAVGTESETQNILFEINPPWWQSAWALIIELLLLISGAYFIILYRGRRIRKEERLKRDYLSQINKIKDQALQLQMNPHFIFNSLNAIQGFIGTDEEEMAMNYLARFARLIRMIFEHSKGNTITLEEELEFINLYLDLEKLRFKGKVDVEINIDEELEQHKDLINVPPLLIQPLVENSFKHGLFHKKGKGKLNIDYSLIDGVLQIVVQDNGIGRLEAQRISQKNTEKYVSSGIKTTQERIALLNFERRHQRNSINIEDMYNKDGSASGTKTTLKLVVQ